MLEAVLQNARMLSPTVRELSFSAGETFGYEPGQWVNLYFPELFDARGRPMKRAYSIASGPRGDGRFDVIVATNGESPASNALHAASIGQSFKMSGPHGTFVMAPASRPVLMVATGTGIAPLRSMLQAAGSGIGQPVALLYGNRSESDILYRDEFERLERENPLFVLHATLSQPTSDWTGKRGYVQVHLSDVLQMQGGSDCDVYICGVATMVADVERRLTEELHVDAAHQHVDRFNE